jgi:hypothetical protein
MKTDTELETLLRSTLAGRAETIHDARPWVAPAPASVRPRRRWLPVLAAAAIVIAVVAGVFISLRLTRTEHKVIKPAPLPTVCRTTLPSQWRTALSSAGLDAGGRTAGPLSVAADGSVIAMRDDGVHPGDGREIVQLRPGSEPKVLYAIPDPDRYDAQAAYLVDHWLIVALHHQGRPAKHTIPGSSAIGLAAVVVVDINTGHARTLTSASDTGLSINSLAVLDGKAYWDERPSYPAREGVVKSYDPRTGKIATVYQGPTSWLEITGAGLVFYDDREHPLVAADLPAPVEAAMTSFSRRYLASDGSAYAWLMSRKVVGWWAPGNATPIYHKLARAIDTNHGALRLLVAGRFIVTEDDQLIDAANGTAAKLAFHGFFPGRGSLYVSRDGVLAGATEIEGKGHWIDGYWADAAGAVLRVDTGTLPPLTC